MSARRVVARLAVVTSLLVVAASGLIVAAASARSRSQPSSAVKIARAYLGALAAHDASGVCQTFSPELRRFLRGWEPGRSCEGRVAAAHFSNASPGFTVNRIGIIAISRMTETAAGDLPLALRLRYRYLCMSSVGVIPDCHPRVQTRPDVVYLRRSGGRWLIVKPGEIYVETLSFAPPTDI